MRRPPSTPRLPILLPLLAIALSACGESPPPGPAADARDAAPADAGLPPDAASAAQQPPAVAPTPARAVDALPFAAALAVGTPYAIAREAVIAAGWRPVITPACAENVGGEAAICRELPELEVCSGTGAGYCRMAFGSADGSDVLVLRTAGGHDGWSTTGESATVRIDGAERVVAVPAGGACPSADFAPFLEAFAADPAVRAAWTAPLVRVALRYELGEESRRVDGFVRAADFTGFPVVHRGEAFHHVDAEGATDPAPLALRIDEPDADTRDVSFEHGMSEGNRLRFVRRDGCWQLAEDPEPPAA